MSRPEPTGPLLGGVEAGGTKVVCALGTGPDDVVARGVVPTTTPDETLGRVVDWLRAHEPAGRPVAALGVGSFGPLDLDPDSPSFGRITSTPKPGWSGTDLLGALRAASLGPVALDTDVNAAALGEHRWGAARAASAAVYLTVGTGVGGGVVPGGPWLGRGHPEMGHLHVVRHPADGFAGSCPFHGDCVEGLASGPALRARFGEPAEELRGDRAAEAVRLTSFYLGQLVAAVTYLLAPDRIVLGGGVTGLPGLLPAVRREVAERIGGAVATPADGYLVPPALGRWSGVLGALALAADRLRAAPPTGR